MAVQSSMTEPGSKAPAFDLAIANPWIESTNSETRSLNSYPEAKVFVVVFTCNHCPYAVHVESTLVEIARAYSDKGVQFIAICSNDAETYPSDSFDKMAERARDIAMPFPYLWDDSQETAKAYRAACTPDLFIYDAARTLLYRGRIDETRPGQGTAHGDELKAALNHILVQGDAPEKQFPSIGCSIKWRRGNAPA